MTVHMFALAVPRDGAGAEVAEYVAAAVPLLEAGGGTVITRYRTVAHPVGENAPALTLHMVFSETEQAEAVFASEAYRALVDVRERGFERLDVIVTEAVT